MTRRYHVLLERDPGSRRWEVEFGDYDKRVVRAELQDTFDSGRWTRGLKKRDLMVLTVEGDTQREINEAVDALNPGFSPREVASKAWLDLEEDPGLGVMLQSMGRVR